MARRPRRVTSRISAHAATAWSTRWRAARTENKSKIRARVEHVFAVVKRLWGFAKVRYRGLAKNANRAFVALALANVYLCRTRLRAQVRP
nr:transposase [Burkholderia ubonensis]